MIFAVGSVAWPWLIVAFAAGGIFGFLSFAILTISGDERAWSYHGPVTMPDLGYDPNTDHDPPTAAPIPNDENPPRRNPYTPRNP